MTIPPWIAKSRKAQIAIGTIVLSLVSRLLGHFGLPPDEINEITRSMLAIGGVWMASIAIEDSGKPPLTLDDQAVLKDEDWLAGHGLRAIAKNDVPLASVSPAATTTLSEGAKP